MDEKVTRFPISLTQKIFNRRGQRAVHCTVTGRYFVFTPAKAKDRFYYPEFNEHRNAVVLNVMTENYEGGKDRKICELIVTLENLEEVVRVLRSDIE